MKTLEFKANTTVMKSNAYVNLSVSYWTKHLCFVDYDKAWALSMEIQSEGGELSMLNEVTKIGDVWVENKDKKISFGGGVFLLEGNPVVELTVCKKGSKFYTAFDGQSLTKTEYKSIKEIVENVSWNLSSEYFTGIAKEELDPQIVLESKIRNWWGFWGSKELENKKQEWINICEKLREEPSKLRWEYDSMFRAPAMVEVLTMMEQALGAGESGIELLKNLNYRLIQSCAHASTGRSQSETAKDEADRHAIGWVLSRLDSRGMAIF